MGLYIKAYAFSLYNPMATHSTQYSVVQFLITCPLCWEATGDQWIPLTKGQ